MSELDDVCLNSLLAIVEAVIKSGEASEMELFETLEPEQKHQFWEMLSYAQRRQLSRLEQQWQQEVAS